MVPQEKIDIYFEWLLSGLGSSALCRKYRRVIRILFDTPFRVCSEVPMDANRIDDAMGLRTCFLMERACSLPDFDCSVLEVMIALADRMEHDIMHDDSLGDRNVVWFWSMFECLGLTHKTPDDEVIDILERFLDREYGRSGSGGLFETRDPSIDMRELQIWDQMNMYLNDIL